ncbi:unnamed protein product [Effrenium voratum]|nr:unnamed protein product [Effrenium voratum]
MASMAVAERADCAMFNQMGAGAAVRVAGRCSFETNQWVLNTTDGGSLPVSLTPGLDPGAGNVELVGTKGPQGQLCAVSVAQLPGEMDAELWNQAVQLMQHPKMRHLFQPQSGC